MLDPTADLRCNSQRRRGHPSKRWTDHITQQIQSIDDAINKSIHATDETNNQHNDDDDNNGGGSDDDFDNHEERFQHTETTEIPQGEQGMAHDARVS